MRCMESNKRRMWLSKPGGLVELTDDEGLGTGEYVQVEWAEPEPLMVNASAQSGVRSAEPYGMFAAYDLSLVAEDNRWGIEEGEPDPSDRKGAYSVERVSTSLQFVSFGLSKVEGK